MAGGDDEVKSVVPSADSTSVSDVQPGRADDGGAILHPSSATSWLPQEPPPGLELPPIDGPVTLDDDFATLRAGRAVPDADAAEPVDAVEPAAPVEPAGAGPEAAAGPPTAPTEDEIRRMLSELKEPRESKDERRERDWRRLVGVAVVTLLAIVAFVQVVTGGNLVWVAGFAVGEALVVVGGPTVIRSAAARGAVPLAALSYVVAGVLLIVICTIAIGIRAQQFSTRPASAPNSDGVASYDSRPYDGAAGETGLYGVWQPAQ